MSAWSCFLVVTGARQAGRLTRSHGKPYIRLWTSHQLVILNRMKTLLVLLVIAFASSILASYKIAEPNEAVRHVVVFKYKDGATDEQIKVITDAFRDLKDKIPGIIGFEHGINNSPEGLNQGFTHVYLLTFEDEAARDTYLPHPDHAAFGDILKGSGIFDGAYVVDYTIQE